MIFKKILMVSVFVFGSSGVVYADASLEAIEFMIAGEIGFKDGGLEEVSLKDCVLKYSNIYSNPFSSGGKINFTHDFNKAKWRTSRFVGPNFMVSCSGVCTTVESSLSNTYVNEIRATVPRKKIGFRVITTRDRFNVALGDFQEQCKGETSKY
jgi:hypothetical protein